MTGALRAFKVFRDAGLVSLANRARRGEFDYITSPYTNPNMVLYAELIAVGQDALAKRAKRGEFNTVDYEKRKLPNGRRNRL